MPKFKFDPNKSIKLEDTLIEQGGVMRCCIGTVATEYEGKTVKIGDTSECHHCHTKFVLLAPKDVTSTCYCDLDRPIWKPEWQIKKKD